MGHVAAARPDVAGGLKRGFTFFFHRPGEPFADDREHARQLLVAASPHDEIGDTHWYRPDFDHALVREAEAAGAIYLDETRARPRRIRRRDRRRRSTARGTAQPLRIDASFRRRRERPARISVQRAAASTRRRSAGCRRRRGSTRTSKASSAGTVSTPSTTTPPYPAGRCGAASRVPRRLDLGAAVQQRHHERRRRADRPRRRPAVAPRKARRPGTPARDACPSVREQFRRRARVLPVRARAAARVPHAARCAGASWALLPSAAGVIDPLLSTGFPLTLLGIGASARRPRAHVDGPGARRRARALRADHARRAGRDRAAGRRALRDHDRRPPLFKRLTLLYFAAASFSETARRLGPAGARARVSAPRPSGDSAPSCTRAAASALANPARPRPGCAARPGSIAAIEPFDIAGLLDRTRRDWYPVLAEDLVANASKLNASAGGRASARTLRLRSQAPSWRC